MQLMSLILQTTWVPSYSRHTGPRSKPLGFWLEACSQEGINHIKAAQSSGDVTSLGIH